MLILDIFHHFTWNSVALPLWIVSLENKETIASIWRENMLGYMSANIICFAKGTVFAKLEENCELEGTDKCPKTKSRTYFLSQMGLLCLLSVSNIFAACELGNITRLFPSFSRVYSVTWPIAPVRAKAFGLYRLLYRLFIIYNRSFILYPNVFLNVEDQVLSPNATRIRHCSKSMSEDCVLSRSSSFVISPELQVLEYDLLYRDSRNPNFSRRLHPGSVLDHIAAFYFL